MRETNRKISDINTTTAAFPDELKGARAGKGFF